MPQKLFVEIDKRQAEWIVVAYLAQDPRMIEVHEQGLDPHATTGRLISGLSEDIVKLEHKLVGHLSDPQEIARLRFAHPEIKRLCFPGSPYFFPRSMSIRQAGKKSNHGLNYNMGYSRFALENEMEEAEAKRIVNGYFEAYLGIKLNFHKDVQRQLREDRTLINCFGRKRRFLDAWGDDLFDAAYSFIPQSTVGDVVNRAILASYDDPSEYMQPVESLANVHDSVLFQYPVQEPHHRIGLAYACWQWNKHMTPELEYHGRKFVIHSDLKLGLNWGDYEKEKNPLGMREVPTDWSIEDLRNKIEETWETLNVGQEARWLHRGLA